MARIRKPQTPTARARKEKPKRGRVRRPPQGWFYVAAPPEECCDTPAGKLPPTAQLVVTVGADGDYLKVRLLNIEHECGIRAVELLVRIYDFDGFDYWEYGDDNAYQAEPQVEREWGTGAARRLPENLRGRTIRVKARIVSVCGTENTYETFVELKA